VDLAGINEVENAHGIATYPCSAKSVPRPKFFGATRVVNETQDLSGLAAVILE
jgi:hypothetical protein